MIMDYELVLKYSGSQRKYLSTWPQENQDKNITVASD